jgi:hypothetical protein
MDGWMDGRVKIYLLLVPSTIFGSEPGMVAYVCDPS